ASAGGGGDPAVGGRTGASPALVSCRLLMTPSTPATMRAALSAWLFACALGTTPFKVTTPPRVTTSMYGRCWSASSIFTSLVIIESLRAARSASSHPSAPPSTSAAAVTIVALMGRSSVQGCRNRDRGNEGRH